MSLGVDGEIGPAHNGMDIPYGSTMPPSLLLSHLIVADSVLLCPIEIFVQRQAKLFPRQHKGPRHGIDAAEV